jgi:Protein of unknown function (DUF2393)
MSDPQRPASDSSTDTAAPTGNAAPAPAMFASRPNESAGVPMMAWGVAGLVVLVVIVGLVLATRHKSEGATNTVQPITAYAANLPVTQLAMSESESLSGGKSTFIDGHIKNAGSETVTGITVQVLFANDENLAPQVETLPLWLIRTRQPYIDTQAVGANPLKPGDEQDFRLIFESIPTNWNTQMPEIHIVRVVTK